MIIIIIIIIIIIVNLYIIKKYLKAEKYSLQSFQCFYIPITLFDSVLKIPSWNIRSFLKTSISRIIRKAFFEKI